MWTACTAVTTAACSHQHRNVQTHPHRTSPPLHRFDYSFLIRSNLFEGTVSGCTSPENSMMTLKCHASVVFCIGAARACWQCSMTTPTPVLTSETESLQVPWHMHVHSPKLDLTVSNV